jgi:hypothetical protein
VSPFLVPVIVAAGLVLLTALWTVRLRGGLTAARDRCAVSWGDLEACLRRRHAVVDDLVATLREAGIGQPTELQVLIDARMGAGMATAPFDRAVTERELSSAIGLLDQRAEHDHRLATGQIADYLHELGQLEEDTQIARRIYNVDVRLFLSRKRAFPASLLARGPSFQDRSYFELDNTRLGRVATADFTRAAA